MKRTRICRFLAVLTMISSNHFSAFSAGLSDSFKKNIVLDSVSVTGARVPMALGKHTNRDIAGQHGGSVPAGGKCQ